MISRTTIKSNDSLWNGSNHLCYDGDCVQFDFVYFTFKALWKYFSQEWNARHSFSHQEVTTEVVKNHRPLRHSYSQREVSRYSKQASSDSLSDLKLPSANKVNQANSRSTNNHTVTKSTPHLALSRTHRHFISSNSLLQSDVDEATNNNMVTRRFKKGSVYDTLASSSGLDFSPVVQLKTYNPRREDSSPKLQPSKPTDRPKEKPKPTNKNSPTKKTDDNFKFIERQESQNDSVSSSNMNLIQQPSENKQTENEETINSTCIAAHEKYPSWPIVSSESPSVSHRSHSWTGQTDYPKEKISYSRPKKDYQYKISTNQLQPVLERSTTSDYGNSNKAPEESVNSSDRHQNGENYRNAFRACGNSFRDCSGKQFDFEAFHTPCIPQYYEDKDFPTHSPPERDETSSSTSRTKSQTESVSSDVTGFCGIYEDAFQHKAQYTAPLSSTWNKLKSIENKNVQKSPDTPFLDRLRMENAWQVPPPPALIHQQNIPSLQHQLQHEQQELLQQAQEQPGNDFELSSENGTWMGSMESSYHRKSLPKWQGSYSDLSTLSTQLSNRSSLFDSGHSTMPESGRLSPQSSCDSTAASLLLDVPTRAQVVARHGCHREIVAHSARVQQPERHGSDSVLYYATGSPSRLKPYDNSKISQKIVETAVNTNKVAAEDAVFRSHASLTLSPSLHKSNFTEPNERRKKCPTRQDSRNSSNSFSSDDSYPRFRCHKNESTSGSSSDVSNITCISNYAGSTKLQSKNVKSSQVTDNAQHQVDDQSLLAFEPLTSKSMDETTRKPIFPQVEKKQRISDPELKAIQKQAVMSFYQRMSLAESIKSDSKPLLYLTSPPPPYESTARLRASVPKLSILPNKSKPSSSTEPQTDVLGKICDFRLSNNYSKSVPNLVILKGQSLDLPPSHPFFKQSYNNSSQTKDGAMQQKKGSPLVKDEIISWDQLPNVLEKKREAFEKATSPSNETKDPPQDNGGCTSGLNYLKAAHKSPRKVQLKEVHHSNETASVQVMTPEGVTLVQANEKKAHKRRPAPPPPPKQPPRRPPPPPPPITPPLTNVIVEGVEDSIILSDDKQCPSSPDLPLPPPPTAEEVRMMFDEPTPPPLDAKNVDIPPRTLDGTSLIYPKNSYMSYRSERKLSRQGFDGKYRQSFHTPASPVDLATVDSCFQDETNSFSPNHWELLHNIRPQGTTVIFHSNCIQQNVHSQKSNSQDSVLSDETVQNFSNCTPSMDEEKNESSPGDQTENSKTHDCVHQAMPYNITSQEEENSDICNSPDSHHTTDKKTSLTPNDTIINCEMVLNKTLKERLKMSESRTNVDHNQNSLKCSIVDEHASETLNGNDFINRINSSTQTTDTPKLYRKLVKTEEELACERLSRDFIHQYGDIALKHLFVPASNHKTLSDYMESLWNLDFEKSSQNDQLNSCSSFGKSESNHDKENGIKEENCLELNVKNSEMNGNKNEDNEMDLKKKKEELIASIEKKLDSLREEQTNIRAEMLQNDKLGQEISQHLQQIAKPSETEKYILHVEEQEKIVNLLLSLSGRLARSENILRSLPDNYCPEEKKNLESKRNKLKEQHEDACRLKESIDRRSNNISTFLHKCFSDEEYAKYDRFMKMKTKFLIDIREIDEKINLGEEQLAALKVAAHLWKSANS